MSAVTSQRSKRQGVDFRVCEGAWLSFTPPWTWPRVFILMAEARKYMPQKINMLHRRRKQGNRAAQRYWFVWTAGTAYSVSLHPSVVGLGLLDAVLPRLLRERTAPSPLPLLPCGTPLRTLNTENKLYTRRHILCRDGRMEFRPSLVGWCCVQLRTDTGC